MFLAPKGRKRVTELSNSRHGPIAVVGAHNRADGLQRNGIDATEPAKAFGYLHKVLGFAPKPTKTPELLVSFGRPAALK